MDLSDVGFRDIEGEDDDGIDFEAARARVGRVSADPDGVAALVAVAARMGIASLRAPLMALRAARAIAALDGRTQIEDDDVALAATLTLSPRATPRLPEVVEPKKSLGAMPQAEPGRHRTRKAMMQIPNRIANPGDPENDERATARDRG